MTLIDFEAQFEEYLQEWAEKNLNGTEKDDEIEEKELEEYENWLNAPKDWLQGQSPAAYFAAIPDANAAIRLLAEYALKDVAVPALLVNRLIELKEPAYPALCFILASEDLPKEAAARLKAKVITLITEMEKPHPYPLYISWIINSRDGGELEEEAAYALSNAGAEEKELLLDAYRQASSPYAAECFMDILSNFPGDPRIVEHTIDRFTTARDKRAFYANCLGKLGDPEALPYLYEALEDYDMDYYNYTAVKYAIEELGGVIELERDFEGDRDYEKLKIFKGEKHEHNH